MRDATGLLEVFVSKSSTGIGNWINVEGYRHLTALLDFDGDANLTVKCVGSIGKGGSLTSAANASAVNDSPTPTSAQKWDNAYDYIEMIDLQSGSDINGDTGIPVTSGDHRLVNINTDGLKWVTFYITARSAGAASARVKLFRD